MNISVVGLGKLGLPFAFFLASFNNRVFAFDINKNISKQVNHKKSTFVGAINKPTAHVKITKDITRGFIKLKKALI